MDVVTILLIGGLIIFFGFFAELVFRKLAVPDVLFLIILGFALGPYGFGYVNPGSLRTIAPIFTTFTLLFLLFDGAFNIDLRSLLREFSESLSLTSFNFIISALVVGSIVWLSGYSVLFSLLAGFVLGGVSSSFAIPLLKQMAVNRRMYSLLTLESALTDVFCIVFSLTVMEIMKLGGFGLKATLVQLVSLFAIAGLIGLVSGVIWIVLTAKFFEEHNYMLVIAYLLLVYVVTEFLSGNGAIAALTFGLVLRNSKQITSIAKGILTTRAKEKKKAIKGELGISVTTPSEEFFYHQISFLLKTFFFVYIGILIDFSDWKALLIGGLIAVALLISRMASWVLTRKMVAENKSLINSIFARGLAAAAIAQLALQAGIEHADFLVKVTFVTITGTIILSSLKVFIFKMERKQVQPNAKGVNGD